MTRILFGISRSYFLHPYFEFEFFKSSNAPLCCLFEVLIGICILSQKRVTTIFEVSTSSWSLFGILGMISKLFSICVGSFHFLILYHTVCFSTTYDNYPCSDIYLIWQYGLWSFQTGGTKLERFLPKNQHTQRNLLNFENWVSGEVSKIGHNFSKQSDLKIDVIKKCQ